MLSAIKLQLQASSSPPSLNHHIKLNFHRLSSSNLQSKPKKLLNFTSLSIQSNDSSPPAATTAFTSSVGSPSTTISPLSQWNLTNRHIFMLNAVACVVALSTSWLFFSAIPALLAFRRAADSVAKLMDVMREELPDTMAAVRLSGMEISDLTMELGDLGQEITKGVRSTTKAVRVAEDRLRSLTTMVPNALVQGHANLKTKTVEPVLAKSARGVREGIVKGRAFLQMFFSVTQFARVGMNYLASRRQKQ
ncbi:hypothetical protein ACHQM5_022326 [Ranunculus cassubicifolius]